jgi:hypothetical protein
MSEARGGIAERCCIFQAKRPAEGFGFLATHRTGSSAPVLWTNRSYRWYGDRSK